MCLVLGVSLIYQGDELKSQQKLSTVMAVCGWIQIQVWCLFLFSVCSVRSTQVEACFVSFKISFFNCPGFILWAQLCVCSCRVAVALSGRCDSLLIIGSGHLTIHWYRCFISTQGYPPASLGLRWIHLSLQHKQNFLFLELTGVCPPPLWGAVQTHCPGWIYWTRKSRHCQKLLSPEWCPQENPISAWAVPWGIHMD